MVIEAEIKKVIEINAWTIEYTVYNILALVVHIFANLK